MERQQKKYIINDLKKKDGVYHRAKTGGQNLAGKGDCRIVSPGSVYLNYDSAKGRDIIRNEAWLEDTSLLHS